MVDDDKPSVKRLDGFVPSAYTPKEYQTAAVPRTSWFGTGIA